MIRSPLWTLIVLSLLSFAAGFTTRYLFFEGTKLVQQSQNADVKELKKDAVTNDIAYQKQVDDLSKQNIELQFQLQVSQNLLDEAKDSTKEREAKIQKLIAQWDKQKKNDSQLSDVLSKQSSERDKQKIKNGYVALFDDTPCDSLITEVQNYIQENHRKDSVYEHQLSQFDSVISVKDRIIQSDGIAYNNLKALFQKSLSDANGLLAENKNFKKQITGQKVKTKIFSTALFVLTGAFINHIVHH